ncbi:hypothetical protein BC830DRAFT_1124173 [Chytriomyces sp. MP71]|nr:hypothetical protein BC830DRAFT_1124173 [Chytriomyces sp. MP71]
MSPVPLTHWKAMIWSQFLVWKVKMPSSTLMNWGRGIAALAGRATVLAVTPFWKGQNKSLYVMIGPGNHAMVLPIVTSFVWWSGPPLTGTQVPLTNTEASGMLASSTW